MKRELTLNEIIWTWLNIKFNVENIFNILFVIAIPALINPIVIDSKLIFDSIFTIIATILAFIFIKRENDITKHESLILVFTYIIYIQFFISKS